MHHPRRLIIGSLVAGAALVAAGCASFSKKDCLTSNWEAVGNRDGGAGASLIKIDAYVKACAKHGVTPDPVAYFRGREQGLTRYCTEPNAFWEGKQGRSFGDACPDPDGRLARTHADGQRLYQATHRLEMANWDLRFADERADKRARQADGVEEELRNPKLTDEQTRELRDRLNRLRRERRDAVEDGRRAADAIRDAQREVDDVKAMLSPRYGPL